MHAAFFGQSQVVRILLNKGASSSVVADNGGLTTPLMAAGSGLLPVNTPLSWRERVGT